MNTQYIKKHSDTLYSCMIPHNMHLEHRMPNHSIIYVRSGILVINDNETMTEITAGNYVFVKRDCRVRLCKIPSDNKPYKGISLSLQRKILKNYYNMIENIQFKKGIKPFDRVATPLPKNIPLESLFQSLMIYIDNETEPADEILQHKLFEAIFCLLNIHPAFYPTLFEFNESWKIDILDFMEKNYTEDLTLKEFASYTGRSLATFKRDFSKISKTTPRRWIMEHRLEKARELLEKGNQNAQDIGYAVGFKNRSHFHQAFKRYFGYAPGLYSKSS